MASKKSSETPDINCDCYSESHKADVCPPVKNVTHPLVRRNSYLKTNAKPYWLEEKIKPTKY